MNVKAIMNSAVLCVVVGLLLSGCAGGNFGTMKQEEAGGMTLEALLRDWQSYNIHFAGISVEKPVAILFDPKNDGKNLEVEGLRWWSIKDQQTLRDGIGRVNMLQEHLPRIWKVLGPDDSVYGYVYTPAIRLNIVVVNENTMRVITR
jgi:hypothetical protein